MTGGPPVISVAVEKLFSLADIPQRIQDKYDPECTLFAVVGNVGCRRVVEEHPVTHYHKAGALRASVKDIVQQFSSHILFVNFKGRAALDNVTFTDLLQGKGPSSAYG